MATCKDCLHFEACKQWYTALPDKYHDGCEHFKTRSSFVELPCKVGDTVYCLQPCIKRNAKSYQEFLDSFHFVYELQVVERYATKELIGYLIGYPYFNSYILGKTVFLTREEAEAALAERKASE